MRRWTYVVLGLCFFVFFFGLIFTTSNDFSQDLGRHLKLGEIIVKTHVIPATNLFSYTNPSFPFINHHWFSEVIFYLLTSWFAVNALQVVKVVLLMSTLALLFWLGKQYSSFGPLILAAALYTPLLLDRLMIRPELFAYLFFIYVLAAMTYSEKYLRLAYGLPFVMVFWVNIHISFVFGIFLLGVWLLKLIMKHRSFNKLLSSRAAHLIIISFICLLINPNFLKGALYPFLIFGNYGYSIVENQNLFYLSSVLSNIFISYFFLLTPLTFASLITLLVKRKYSEAFLLSVFTFLAFYQIRHLSFFVFLAIPYVGFAMHSWWIALQNYPWGKQLKTYSDLIALGGSVLLLLSAVLFYSNWFSSTIDLPKRFGVQFTQAYEPGMEFILHNNLKGPIFNDFDIGGYAIYKLYPRYSVFVDNRPETYPAQFMQDIYIRLQEDDSLRKQVFQRYHINTVVLSITDNTPWTKTFSANIANDPDWKLVYFDSAVVVYTKDTSLPDVRNKPDYFQQTIDNTSDYLDLLAMVNSLTVYKQTTTAENAFRKAAKINPRSCIIKRVQYQNLLQSPYFDKTAELKWNSWYCFL
ncbi:hypothetical protein HGB07_02790 [Candidatus Roizmanbacteria bacterium]|nr:hypothetical protein [Candidatus Roizmanbacteria bacterium]